MANCATPTRAAYGIISTHRTARNSTRLSTRSPPISSRFGSSTRSGAVGRDMGNGARHDSRPEKRPSLHARKRRPPCFVRSAASPEQQRSGAHHDFSEGAALREGNPSRPRLENDNTRSSDHLLSIVEHDGNVGTSAAERKGWISTRRYPLPVDLVGSAIHPRQERQPDDEQHDDRRDPTRWASSADHPASPAK